MKLQKEKEKIWLGADWVWLGGDCLRFFHFCSERTRKKELKTSIYTGESKLDHQFWKVPKRKVPSFRGCFLEHEWQVYVYESILSNKESCEPKFVWSFCNLLCNNYICCKILSFVYFKLSSVIINLFHHFLLALSALVKWLNSPSHI